MPHTDRFEAASSCLLRWTELAARSLGAGRAITVWEEADEPWVEIIDWTDGRRSVERTPPASLDPVVHASVPDLCYWPGSRAEALNLPDGSTQPIDGAPLGEPLASRIGHADVVVMRVSIGTISGCLAISALPAVPEAATFALATCIKQEITHTLETALAAPDVHADARLEERMRLARELHDGVAQALTAIGLHLRAAERLLETSADDARAKLTLARQLVLVEQRDLRFFIRDLKPAPLGALESATTLSTLLSELSARFRSTWGLTVEVQNDLPDGLDSQLRYEIYRIIQEGLLNAARHGEATFADVTLTHADDHASITIRDNGRGFAFQGHFDHWELTAQQRGPVVLKQRVTGVRGILAITSTEAGATLDIHIPLGTTEEQHADSDSHSG
jgi:signal transduction histidine kinase